MPYTTANLETAMCLWEALLADLAKDDPQAVALIERDGTPAARHTVISWVEECEAEWEADRAAHRENEPYDWEHCPLFLSRKLNDLFPDLADREA